MCEKEPFLVLPGREGGNDAGHVRELRLDGDGQPRKFAPQVRHDVAAAVDQEEVQGIHDDGFCGVGCHAALNPAPGTWKGKLLRRRSAPRAKMMVAAPAVAVKEEASEPFDWCAC